MKVLQSQKHQSTVTKICKLLLQYYTTVAVYYDTIGLLMATNQ